MMERVAAEWTRKSEVMADAAMDTSGLGDPEEFCEILYGDPDLIALSQRILWAASVSGKTHQLQTLGALLGGAVARRGDRLDETQLLVTALADVEETHVLVLEVLSRPAPDDDDQRRVAEGALRGGVHFAGDRTGKEPMTWEPGGAWLPEQVEAEVPMTPEFVFGVLSALTRHGLARSLATLDGGQRFRITDLGRALLEVMNSLRGRAQPPAQAGDRASDLI